MSMTAIDLNQIISGFDNACNDCIQQVDFHCTRREAEVLVMLQHEFIVADIAKYFLVSSGTINKHLANLRKKSSCSSLISMGIKLGKYFKKNAKSS